jgi:hypothetical protein
MFSCVDLDRVAEVGGGVAVPMAEEVGQELATAGELRVGGDDRVVEGRRACETMDEHERRTGAGKVEVTELGVRILEVQALHRD